MMSCPIFNLYEFPEYAKIVAEEIEQAKIADPVWHHAYNWRVDEKGSRTTDPNNTTKGVFDDVRLHFVNRNLNIVYLESMVHLALSNNYEYSPLFCKSKELFEHARQFNKELGPFGRMIVWDVPPKSKIAAHIDDLPYQKSVNRYIYTASQQSHPDIEIVIAGYNVPLKPGTMFAFDAIDTHEFTNNSDKHWYFLGIDYWDPIKLNEIANSLGITRDTVLQYDEGMGISYPKCKYWTRH